MGTTNFVDKTTVIQADWLNDVDAGIYQASSGITGASDRTLLSKLSDTVSVKDFGAVGNGVTDDTAAIQAALNSLSLLPSMSGNQGKLYFPRGQYKITSTLDIPSNVLLIGEGFNFASQIVCASGFSGTNVFAIDGTKATGGFMFRVGIKDLTINGTNLAAGSVCLLVQDCYSVDVDGLFLYNFSGKGILVQTNATAVNDITIRRAHIFGKTTADATNGIHITAGNGVVLDGNDIEACATGLLVENDAKVVTRSTYAERNLIGIDHRGNTSGSHTIQGGHIRSPGASGIAATIRGDNCTVIGGRYDANGGSGLRLSDATSKPSNVHLIGVHGDITDTRNWATSNLKADGASWHKTVIANRKVVSDNVGTQLFKITSAYSGGLGGMVDIDLFAQLSGIAFSIYTARYKIGWALSATDTWQQTAVVEYGKTNVNASGNYTLTVTVTASASANVLTINVTANAGGALGEGMDVIVGAEATLWQQQDNGGAYLEAV